MPFDRRVLLKAPSHYCGVRKEGVRRISTLSHAAISAGVTFVRMRATFFDTSGWNVPNVATHGWTTTLGVRAAKGCLDDGFLFQSAFPRRTTAEDNPNVIGRTETGCEFSKLLARFVTTTHELHLICASLHNALMSYLFPSRLYLVGLACSECCTICVE